MQPEVVQPEVVAGSGDATGGCATGGCGGQRRCNRRLCHRRLYYAKFIFLLAAFLKNEILTHGWQQKWKSFQQEIRKNENRSRMIHAKTKSLPEAKMTWLSAKFRLLYLGWSAPACLNCTLHHLTTRPHAEKNTLLQCGVRLHSVRQIADDLDVAGNVTTGDIYAIDRR